VASRHPRRPLGVARGQPHGLGVAWPSLLVVARPPPFPIFVFSFSFFVFFFNFLKNKYFLFF
jgi:hypothetical protein